MTTFLCFLTIIYVTHISAIGIDRPDKPNLLPDPIDYPKQTPHPTHRPTTPPSKFPTISPITNHPTAHPITHKPTRNGDTNSPSYSPTNIPSITPTSAPITNAPTSKQIILGNANENVIKNTDRNNNGKDDRLEFFITPAIPIQAVCLLISLILSIALIYNMYCNKKRQKNKMTIMIKFPVLLAFICNNISIICVMIISIMVATATRWDRKIYNIALIPYYTAMIGYALGKFSLETFFIFRAVNTFKVSVFALSKWIIALLFICSFVLLIGWIMMFYIVTIDQNFDAPYYAYLILATFEMLFVLTLLFLFTKRLGKLILMHKIEFSSTKPSNSRQSTPSSDVENGKAEAIGFSVADLSFQQMRLIFVITRCILLTGFALITTVLFGVVLFYYETFGLHLFINYSLWTIDMTVNCVCLYLNFTFSTQIYRVCCKCCHNGCQKILEHFAAKKILKNHMNMQSLELTELN